MLVICLIMNLFDVVKQPAIAEGVFVAPNATVVGAVELHPGSSVRYTLEYQNTNLPWIYNHGDEWRVV
jgi:hypothetical protein